MIGVYFSGTGNTKHSIQYFLNLLDPSGAIYAMEKKEAIEAIKTNAEIVFAYPIQYSNIPKFVRDFIVNNASLWRGKIIFIMATMGLFSGDGAGCSARLFKKYGAKILGGLHLNMPDCIGDVKALKRSLEENRELVVQAEGKMDRTISNIKKGKYPKEGLNFFYHLAGLFGQRLYFYNKSRHYYTKNKIDESKCIKCGLCASICPMSNITIEDKVVFHDKCTKCYRCFSNCPKQAILIIGKQVIEQCKFEKYKINK